MRDIAVPESAISESPRALQSLARIIDSPNKELKDILGQLGIVEMPATNGVDDSDFDDETPIDDLLVSINSGEGAPVELNPEDQLALDAMLGELLTPTPIATVGDGLQISDSARDLLRGAETLMTTIKPVWAAAGIGRDGLPGIENSDGLENHYAMWVRGEIDELPENAVMNCWQATLTSAVMSGVMTRNELEDWYSSIAGSENKLEALLNHIGYNQAEDVVDWQSSPPQPGDVIVIDNQSKASSDREIGFHVMIAGEHGMVYSHDRSESERAAALDRNTADQLFPGDRQSDHMIHTRFDRVMTYMDRAIAGQNGEPRVRYCSALCNRNT